MKTPLPSFLLASGLALALPSSLSCQQPKDEAALAAAINDFSLGLYQRLATDNDNLCLSPASISTALLMAHAGARGSTAKEMDRVLCLAGSGADAEPTRLAGKALRTAVAALLETLNPPARKPDKKKKQPKGRRRFQRGTPAELRVVNAMWGQDGYPFSAGYVTTLETSHRAAVEYVDFLKNKTAAAGAINSWVDRETKGRIKNLISEDALRRNTRLVLTNAVYFKGGWSEEFQKRATTPAKFHLEGADAVKVPTMHQTEGHGYFADDTVQVLQMRYRGGSHAMVILLPKPGRKLAALEKALTPGRLRELISKLEHESVRVALPRFKITSSLSLRDCLGDMGMGSAFDPDEADFQGINDGREPLWISDVLHKTYIDVDEEGTEAAAATAIMTLGAARPRQPIPFQANRPFLFLLRDVRTGLVLFMGRVMDPRGGS
ncbi:MAG: serpin family protein [Planctomycetota bacterium]|jgi:serpin B